MSKTDLYIRKKINNKKTLLANTPPTVLNRHTTRSTDAYLHVKKKKKKYKYGKRLAPETDYLHQSDEDA